MSDIDTNFTRLNSQLQEARRIGDRYFEAELLFNLGNIYSTVPEKLDIDKAIEYLTEAVMISEQELRWFIFYRASQALGAIHEKLLHDDLGALSVYEAALDARASWLPGSFEEKARLRIEDRAKRLRGNI